MAAKASPLRDAIREAVAELLLADGGRARDAAKIVLDRHPDLVREFAQRLAEDQITKLAANEFKQWSAIGAAARTAQEPLPGMIKHIQRELPASISLLEAIAELFEGAPEGMTVGELLAQRRPQAIKSLVKRIDLDVTTAKLVELIKAEIPDAEIDEIVEALEAVAEEDFAEAAELERLKEERRKT